MSDFCPSIYMPAIKNWIKKNFSSWVYRKKVNPFRKTELLDHVQQFSKTPSSRLSDASFDIFTYHGEDGIIAYLMEQLGNVPKQFVDIGAGDCVKSNCACLAFHLNWNGLFIDKNGDQLSIGRKFYKKKIEKGAAIRFLASEVSAENVNEIIAKAGISNEVGLLSIDIDGNDYWIWKALDIIQPCIVVIEAKVEFGHHNIVVPYGPENHHSADNRYNGASVEALVKLGKEKGYKLVGANVQGYNLFFVKNSEDLSSATSADVLTHPETVRSFYPESFFNEHKFVKA